MFDAWGVYKLVFGASQNKGPSGGWPSISQTSIDLTKSLKPQAVWRTMTYPCCYTRTASCFGNNDCRCPRVIIDLAIKYTTIWRWGVFSEVLLGN